MHGRLPALTLALAGVLVLVPSAFAARVTVRVEGKTQTIFGAAPRTVEARTPFEALEAASAAGEFFYHAQTSDFGRYIDQIGRFPAAGTTGWVFKVNWASPPVGADAVQLADGDTVLWYWAQFGVVAGGPPTLRLTRVGRSNCYRAVALGDSGASVAVTGVTVSVDGRRVRTRAAGAARVACVGRHRGLVRATAPNAVRSNAVK